MTQSFTGHVNILQCCDASSAPARLSAIPTGPLWHLLLPFATVLPDREGTTTISEHRLLLRACALFLFLSHVHKRRATSYAPAGDGNYLLSCSNGFDGEGCETFLWDRRKVRKTD